MRDENHGTIGWAQRASNRVRSVIELVRHFAKPDKWFFIPLIAVLLLAGSLMLLSAGLSQVAPFVYALF